MTKRRGFLQGSLTGAAAALAAFGINPALAQEVGKVAGRSDKPLKAAFSNAGLQATWCAQGKLAALAYSAPTNEEFQKKVAQMDKVKKDDAKDTATISKMESDIKTSIETIKTTQAEIPSGLPLGWDNDHFGWDNWHTKTAGWLITIFAIFMGAPFWFDLLNKISNLRGSGPKPKSSTDKKSKK